MRLKTFTAPSVPEAMALIREELGDDAIIVSTHSGRGGGEVRVTAAMETPAEDDLAAALAEREPRDPIDEIADALRDHNTPTALCEALISGARAIGPRNPEVALAASLDTRFAFGPTPDQPSARPLALIGPPGAGKTVTVAKLATRARLAGCAIDVISADTVRAGGVEQLAALTRVLGVRLHTADGVADLAESWRRRRSDDGPGRQPVLTLIDSPAANPYNGRDMDRLRALLEAMNAVPVLALAAGGDAAECADMAAAFAEVGAARILATRLDVARRLGGVLAAADVPTAAGRMKLVGAGVAPDIADGLKSINPIGLARLLLPSASQCRPALRAQAV